MNTILVTGSEGQVGRELQDLQASFPAFNFIFYNKAQLNITDSASVTDVFQQHHPQFLINCAAYTAVDKAETEKEKAMLVNAHGPALLAAACRQFGCRMVHLSTDYVFNGQGSRPYREDDAVEPLNFYGLSKAEGEKNVMEQDADAIIIRTSWVYSAYGNNFVKTMLRLMKEKEAISVVNDQKGSPTYAADLAAAIMHIIATSTWKAGIYHYTNTGETSWYQFAAEIGRLVKTGCNINPIDSSHYPTAARRPSYSVLDSSLICRQFGLKLFPWQQSLQRCLFRLNALLP